MTGLQIAFGPHYSLAPPHVTMSLGASYHTAWGEWQDLLSVITFKSE